MEKGKLYGTRCYLIGAMDRVADAGAGWRERITPFLVNKGIVALNPCDKPIKVGHEGAEDRTRRRELKLAKRYDTLRKELQIVRAVDLRMVDMSDFLICNIDTSVHACGTYEELFWANRLKRPILVHCEQGKQGVPDWLFAVLPHQFFFNSWSRLRAYVTYVHHGHANHLKRWMYFDYERLTPEGQFEYYESRKKGV